MKRGDIIARDEAKEVGSSLTGSGSPEAVEQLLKGIYEEGQKSYGEASCWLARQYLILLDENYKGDLYNEVKRKQGGRAMDFTGFMVGWAENAARYCKNLPEKHNPAIIEI